MTILIDSDVLIEVLRARNPEILSIWQDLGTSDHVLLCSPVTIAELWHGARPSEYDALNALFDSFICVPADRTVGKLAGEFLRRYHKSHNVELADALIGAAASVHNAALWTRNRKHYPMKELEFFTS